MTVPKYLVRWKPCPENGWEADETWEPAENIDTTPEFQQYEDARLRLEAARACLSDIGAEEDLRGALRAMGGPRRTPGLLRAKSAFALDCWQRRRAVAAHARRLRVQ